MGISDVVVLDSKGIVSAGRDGLNESKSELASRTNPRGLTGGAVEALAGADVFIGVSAGLIPEELIASMNDDSIVFALSNPDPEMFFTATGARLSPMAATMAPVTSGGISRSTQAVPDTCTTNPITA